MRCRYFKRVVYQKQLIAGGGAAAPIPLSSRQSPIQRTKLDFSDD